VLDIPDDVDLAIIAVPAEHVLAVADECANKKVRGMVVISAGFRETGPDGAAREEALLTRARSNPGDLFKLDGLTVRNVAAVHGSGA